jgi:hypothetical protein
MHSLLDPAILFFIFGVVAASLKSNLEIPPAISRFLSLYLLMALGLKGGFALSKSSFTQEVAARSRRCNRACYCHSVDWIFHTQKSVTTF